MTSRHRSPPTPEGLYNKLTIHSLIYNHHQKLIQQVDEWLDEIDSPFKTCWMTNGSLRFFSCSEKNIRSGINRNAPLYGRARGVSITEPWPHSRFCLPNQFTSQFKEISLFQARLCLDYVEMWDDSNMDFSTQCLNLLPPLFEEWVKIWEFPKTCDWQARGIPDTKREEMPWLDRNLPEVV